MTVLFSRSPRQHGTDYLTSLLSGHHPASLDPNSVPIRHSHSRHLNPHSVSHKRELMLSRNARVTFDHLIFLRTLYVSDASTLEFFGSSFIHCAESMTQLRFDRLIFLSTPHGLSRVHSAVLWLSHCPSLAFDRVHISHTQTVDSHALLSTVCTNLGKGQTRTKCSRHNRRSSTSLPQRSSRVRISAKSQWIVATRPLKPRTIRHSFRVVYSLRNPLPTHEVKDCRTGLEGAC